MKSDDELQLNGPVRNPIRIVLVRPRNPNNIGAAARAMKNFGFDDLVIVAPHPPVWEEARIAAVGAADLLTSARVATRIEDAIEDRTLVIGTADRRRGTSLTPRDLKRELATASRRIALVFGSEKSGLTNEELSHCHRVLTVPTTPECPSMNLAQAVAVCCYELAELRLTDAPEATRTEDDAKAGDVSHLLDQTLIVLRESGFLDDGSERRMQAEFRRSLGRMRLINRDVTLWRGALAKILTSIRKD